MRDANIQFRWSTLWLEVVLLWSV